MYTQVTHLYQRGPNDQSPTGQQHSNNGSNGSEHRETLDCIARSLRLHETLDARQLRAIMEDTHAVHTGPL